MTLALLAPDAFKGTLAAERVAAALARGFSAAGWEVDACPLADGGEGTSGVLVRALGGELHECAVHDPLGRPVQAAFALLEEGGTAVLDASAASGLWLVAPEERDPEAADTRGTGELVAAALAHGAERILVGVGGSATTDGGLGAIEAIERAGGLAGARLVCLCDVRSLWEQAAAVFGPQKGADAAGVARLAERLERLAERLPRDPRGLELAGAAGGLAGGLWARFEAELVPGATFVMDAVGFGARAGSADVVVTGEGRLDATSAEGKVVGEVAARCRESGVPAHAVVGRDAADRATREALGLASVREAEGESEIAAAARQIAAASAL